MSDEANFQSMDQNRLLPDSGKNGEGLQIVLDDSTVKEALRPVAAGLAAFFAVIAVAHAVVLPKAVALPMIASAAGTALALVGLHQLLPRWSIPYRHAHLVATGLALMVLWNSLLHLYLVSDPVQSTHLMLLIIGAGFFFLSAKWLSFVIGATVVGWALVCWKAVPSPNWIHFGFGLLSASLLSVLAFVVRRRSLCRLERLRLHVEFQNQQLQQEITKREQIDGALQRAYAELEVRVQQRTAELEESNERLRAEIGERQRVEEERRKLELEVQHTQRLESLGVLAGGIAHDFNNLLTGILGNADLALLELSPYSGVRQRIEDVKVTAVRAAELTRQMLAYSGRGKFIVEAVDLNEFIEEMGQLLQISISKKAALQFQFEASLPQIQADPSQIRQVVMNLITNASEAIGDKRGVISVRTSRLYADRHYLSETYWDENLEAGCYVTLEVSDTGCGMEPEIQQRIFEPFFSTKFTGRGLGLAAVLGIVRGHHGAIRVYSEAGKGTTFKILFPVSSRDVPVETKPAKNSSEGWQSQGLFLVVDDEEAVRSVAKLMLEKVGFTILTANDGEAGVQLFRQHSDKVVAVLLDLTMPGLNAEETFRKMRRIRPDVRVILTSGYNEQDTVQQFAGKGLAAFVQKPFQFNKLLEKVRQVMET